MKPVTKEKIAEAVNNLRFPIKNTERFRAVTFGGFEFLVNGSPVKFSRSKAKEMLAYLIDMKGESVNRKSLRGCFSGTKSTRKERAYISRR